MQTYKAVEADVTPWWWQNEGAQDNTLLLVQFLAALRAVNPEAIVLKSEGVRVVARASAHESLSAVASKIDALRSVVDSLVEPAPSGVQ